MPWVEMQPGLSLNPEPGPGVKSQARTRPELNIFESRFGPVLDWC